MQVQRQKFSFLGKSRAGRLDKLDQLDQPYQSSQSGQIAVIVLLLMVVLMTVGLSLASRTTQELFLSSQQAESTRVFNAAESGIEDALSQDFSEISGSVPFTGTVEDIENAEVEYSIVGSSDLETMLAEGKSIMVNLSDENGNPLNDDGSVRISWWKNDANCNNDPASIIVSKYYLDGTETKADYYPVGPCSGDAERNDDFSTPPQGSDGYNYQYDVSIGGSEGVKFLRIKAVYNDTDIRIASSTINLPAQFYIVRSTATNTQGDETRTVEVKRTLSTAPSFMDYALYTPGSLVHE